MALKPQSKRVFEYVKQMDGQKITSGDIAEALQISKRSVDGIITKAFQDKGLMERVPAEVEMPDGSHKAVKFIQLTEAGKSFDPEAEVAKAE